MKLNEAKKLIFEKKPKFKDFYGKNKEKKWVNYINESYPQVSNIKNKKEFSKVFFNTVKSILGEKKATKALASIEQTGFVSTADHHGLLCHPFFSNMTIARSSNKILNRPETQITLTVGAVSPTNSSFPRSIFFHDKNLDLQKIHMVSLKWRQRPLYGIPAISQKEFLKIKDYFFGKDISKKNKKRFSSFIEKCLERDDLWKPADHRLLAQSMAGGQKRFCEQLTILNDIWWDEIFGGLRGDILYLEVEELVKNILLSSFEKPVRHSSTNATADGTDILSEIFFNEERRNLYLKNFDGVTGAHNIQNKTGSFLFWFIDEKENKRKQLFLNGKNLETEDKKTIIPLESDLLKKYLNDYSLMPSMALCYSILAFHYGLTLGGGFSQIQYLGDMKIAWGKVFPEFKKEFENVRTDIFSGEAIITGISKGQVTEPATLADFLIYPKDPKEADKLAEKTLSEITIGESLDAMMYELYEIVSGSYEPIEDLPKPRKTLMSQTEKEMKLNKCLYCGNNPVNHKTVFFMQSLSIFLSPIMRPSAYIENWVTFKVAKTIAIPYIFFFRLVGMLKMNTDPKLAHTERSLVIWEEAIKRGIPMEQFVIWGKPIEQYRARVNNEWFYFESLPIPPKMSSIAYAWIDDKAILKKKLLKQNIATPNGESVSSWKQALSAFNKLRKPVICKPEVGSRGRHTTTHIYTEEDLKLGFNVAQELCHFVVTEEHLLGSVYRGTYIGGEIVGILRGDPPRITGDGIKNIKELILEKNKNKNPKVKDVVADKKIETFIARQGFDLDSILPKNKTIDLSEKIGISYGGYSKEMIAETHPKILEELKKAGDLLNVPIVGFDFIVEDPTTDPTGKHWGIIEANSLPFINLHHFPLEGTPQNAAAKVWDLWGCKE
ncbi:MAG: hypothetical protein WCV55_01820 [Candidatus Paceibacterota bacterium]